LLTKMDNLAGLTATIASAYKNHSDRRAFTVAVSGIDASGKGHISHLLQNELEKKGYTVANINIDPWQNPMPVRLQGINSAENFYNNVFRWDDFFQQLIKPLQEARHIFLETMLIRTHADDYYSFTYNFNNIDILVIEGILLFQKKFEFLYDYKVWIDCSFETGMERAVERNIEKLDKERLVHDYHTIYYAAQRLHLERDNPLTKADIIFDNN